MNYVSPILLLGHRRILCLVQRFHGRLRNLGFRRQSYVGRGRAPVPRTRESKQKLQLIIITVDLSDGGGGGDGINTVLGGRSDQFISVPRQDILRLPT